MQWYSWILTWMNYSHKVWRWIGYEFNNQMIFLIPGTHNPTHISKVIHSEILILLNVHRFMDYLILTSLHIRSDQVIYTCKITLQDKITKQVIFVCIFFKFYGQNIATPTFTFVSISWMTRSNWFIWFRSNCEKQFNNDVEISKHHFLSKNNSEVEKKSTT